MVSIANWDFRARRMSSFHQGRRKYAKRTRDLKGVTEKKMVSMEETVKCQSLLLSSTDKHTRHTHMYIMYKGCSLPLPLSPSGILITPNQKSVCLTHRSPLLQLAVHFNKPLRSWGHSTEPSLSSVIYVFFEKHEKKQDNHSVLQWSFRELLPVED